MIAIIKNRTANYWFVAFTALASINLWSFQLLNKKVYSALDMLAIGGCFLIVFFLSRKIKSRELNFSTNVYLFLFVPFLSCFGANIYHDQPLALSFFLTRVNFYWLFYFALHILNVPAKQILKLMVFIGGVWIFFTVVQQFTFPHYYFYTRSETEDHSIKRAGVYRFVLNGTLYGLFFIIYFFHQYLTKQKVKYLFFVLCGLIGMYYLGTRQFLAASLFCMALSVYFSRGKAKLNAITMGLSALVALLLFKDVLFGDYIKMTTGQVENSESDIRTLSANFFLNEYWPSWVTKLIGNGASSSEHSYGQEIDAIRKYFHFYRSDVGIIGSYNMFGIFYVINVIWVNLKGLQSKYYDRNNRFLRLLFFNTLMLILLNESSSNPTSIPFLCMVFYLIDKTYLEKKLSAETVA